ncbi:hypothetical protein GCM10023185_25490 [Hymenobacter saemangeumensis]|uniref:Outer membrane protein beta-barrel domain-containing protein n=1 Tax=Hymenobacter saemangeumensis TaxID=1084522 RepID=A0ABP8IHS4_9BACT
MSARYLAGLLLAGAASVCTPALAAAPPDTLAVKTSPAADSPGPRLPWYRPRHAVAQLAGGMGLAAAGVGYEFLRNRVEADLLLGYVPARYAGSALGVATAKLLYSPFRVQPTEKLQLLPLTVGAYVSYTHGTENSGEQGQYPSGYYWFSAHTRYGPLLGSRITYLGAPVRATGQPRKLSFYYELGSNDLYIASYLTNRDGGLGIGQLLTLGLGVKADF